MSRLSALYIRLLRLPWRQLGFLVFKMADTSAEAEYRAVAHVVAKCCWLRQLLEELHILIPSAIIVYCDNVSAIYAIYMTVNPVHHRRTKHIKIAIHFVREKVALGHYMYPQLISSRTL